MKLFGGVNCLFILLKILPVSFACCGLGSRVAVKYNLNYEATVYISQNHQWVAPIPTAIPPTSSVTASTVMPISSSSPLTTSTQPEIHTFRDNCSVSEEANRDCLNGECFVIAAASGVVVFERFIMCDCEEFFKGERCDIPKTVYDPIRTTPRVRFSVVALVTGVVAAIVGVILVVVVLSSYFGAFTYLKYREKKILTDGQNKRDITGSTQTVVLEDNVFRRRRHTPDNKEVTNEDDIGLTIQEKTVAYRNPDKVVSRYDNLRYIDEPFGTNSSLPVVVQASAPTDNLSTLV